MHVSVSIAWVDAEARARDRAVGAGAGAPVQGDRDVREGRRAGRRDVRADHARAQRRSDGARARARREAGAQTAGWVLLRLPGAVAQVFEERVRVALPLAADKILHRIRETRGGEKLYDSRFAQARPRRGRRTRRRSRRLFETTVQASRAERARGSLSGDRRVAVSAAGEADDTAVAILGPRREHPSREVTDVVLARGERGQPRTKRLAADFERVHARDGL